MAWKGIVLYYSYLLNRSKPLIPEKHSFDSLITFSQNRGPRDLATDDAVRFTPDAKRQMPNIVPPNVIARSPVLRCSFNRGRGDEAISTVCPMPSRRSRISSYCEKQKRGLNQSPAKNESKQNIAGWFVYFSHFAIAVIYSVIIVIGAVRQSLRVRRRRTKPRVAGSGFLKYRGISLMIESEQSHPGNDINENNDQNGLHSLKRLKCYACPQSVFNFAMRISNFEILLKGLES